MGIYVHVVDQCTRDAKKHGVTQLVEKTKQQVVGTQALVGFDAFSPSPFLKRALGRSFRLLCSRHHIGEDVLVLFLRVLPRGSNEYDDFGKNWDKDTDAYVSQLIPYTEAQIVETLQGLRHTEPAPRREALSDSERSLLYQVFDQDVLTGDLFILESGSWVEAIRSAEMVGLLGLFQQALASLDLSRLARSRTNSECHSYWDSARGVGFVYIYRPELNRLLLLAPATEKTSLNVAASRLSEQLARLPDDDSVMTRLAARSYPHLMVEDRDYWLAIERNEEANLALSPEEAELLESIRSAGSRGEYSFPLFINGRAGSGKSTMLQYLAADFVHFALTRGGGLRPLYMTCSAELLDRAKRVVRGLLTSHYAHLLRESVDEKLVEAMLEESFVVFHEFLHRLLPDHVRELLLPENRVNFARFRRLWHREFSKRREARQLSPEVAWHVIRSYIKGQRCSPEDDLDPDEFAALPRRRRTVSLETYRMVYERVWESWYKRLCENGGLWDDQDLAAYAVSENVASGWGAAAVLCDEAQDFTPIELDLIFQLSIFSKRSLTPEEMKRLPFVFAGDPLQTINPSGFSWESVRADFHERFCAVLDPHRKANVEICHKELSLNYRSAPAIVRFCNLVQLMRAGLLGRTDIKPQSPWLLEEDAPNSVWFAAISDEKARQSMLERNDLVKIVNCEDGEETRFALHDPVLRELRRDDDGVFPNVLGPARAKGLEFRSVVLYGFAATTPPGYEELLRSASGAPVEDVEAMLPVEYFLNRLYVGASRAKSELIVVDDEGEFDRFWRFATDPAFVDELLERVKNADEWRGVIGYLVRGGDDCWRGEAVDFEEQAKDYEREGRAARDPYLLRQAALAYRAAGKEDMAGRVLGFAYECEGRFREAAERYEETGLRDEAFRCYWNAGDFQQLLRISVSDARLSKRLECRAAMAMTTGNVLDSSFVSALRGAALDEETKKQIVSHPTWKTVLQSFVNKLVEVSDEQDVPWKEVYATVKEFALEGVLLASANLARTAALAGEHVDAVRIWEELGETESEEYALSKATVAPYPENLRWLSRLRRHSEILAIWRDRHPDPHVLPREPDQVVQLVIESAINTGDFELAALLLARFRNRDALARLLAEVAAKRALALAPLAVASGLKELVASRDWEGFVRAAESGDFSRIGKAARPFKSFIRDNKLGNTVMKTAVEVLASSEELVADAEKGAAAAVTGFLEKHFLGTNYQGMRSLGLKPLTLGAAFERAGKMKDALAYYEALLKEKGLSDALRRSLGVRYVRTLEKYAEILEERDETRKARRLKKDAEALRARLNLGRREIPDYPVIRQSRQAVEKPQEWQKGDFKFVLSREHSRLRIENIVMFETVTLFIDDRTLRGDASFLELPPPRDSARTWSIPGWGMVITLGDESTGRRVEARFGSASFSLQV